MSRIIEFFRNQKPNDAQDFGNAFLNYFKLRYEEEREKLPEDKRKSFTYESFSLFVKFRFGDKEKKVEVIVANPDVLLVRRAQLDQKTYVEELEFINPESITGFQEVPK